MLLKKQMFVCLFLFVNVSFVVVFGAWVDILRHPLLSTVSVSYHHHQHHLLVVQKDEEQFSRFPMVGL